MPRFDRLDIGARGEVRRLDRQTGASHAQFEAGIPGLVVEEVQTERVQNSEIADLQLAGDGVPQRSAAVRGQLGDEAIGQRTQGVILVSSASVLRSRQ